MLSLLVAGTAAIEPARSAVLEFLGLKSVRIERREPAAPPAPTRAPGALGEDLGLGEAMSLEQARRRAGFTAAPPAALGAPDAVYFDDGDPPGGRVTYVYRPRPGLPQSGQTGVGLLVTEMRAVVSPFIEKAAGPGTRVQRLTVGGGPAYFLSGAPHGFAYAEPDGSDPRFEDQRLAGSTLLVERDGLLLRIEAEIARERAVEIAESITATSRRRTGS
jgi:hypothetical protein